MILNNYINKTTKLKKMHKNLSFTKEVGPSTLAFLDTSITLPTTENGSFISKIFRKSTYTGLILNYSAVCPYKWKFGLMQCLFHRAYTVSSNWYVFSKEIDFLKGIFLKNGYPENVFFSCLRNFLNQTYKNVTKAKVMEDKVETIFFVPYIGLPSVIFGRKLREMFKKYYCIDIRIVFTTFKVKNYFSLKCRTPMPLLANVVYKFQCLRDADGVYIGKTIRHLVTRVKEHSHSGSAIYDHLLQCEECKKKISCNLFTVIDSGRNDFEISIKEALHIKSKKPRLNKQMFSQGASFTLNIF